MVFKRLFRKRSARQSRIRGVLLQPAINADEFELTMSQVSSYANVMAVHRGYSHEAAFTLAKWVVFLERRNFPGLASLCREMVLGQNEPMPARMLLHRPDGRAGGMCPYFYSLDVEPLLDALTAHPLADRIWVPAPSNPLLVVAALAYWLRCRGRRVLFWWQKDGEEPGYIVVEGFRLEFCPNVEPSRALEMLEDADYIGLSECPDDFQPAPRPQSGFVSKLTLPSRYIDVMENYLRDW